MYTVVARILASPNHVQKQFLFAKEPYVLGPDGTS